MTLGKLIVPGFPHQKTKSTALVANTCIVLRGLRELVIMKSIKSYREFCKSQLFLELGKKAFVDFMVP